MDQGAIHSARTDGLNLSRRRKRERSRESIHRVVNEALLLVIWPLSSRLHLSFLYFPIGVVVTAARGFGSTAPGVPSFGRLALGGSIGGVLCVI